MNVPSIPSNANPSNPPTENWVVEKDGWNFNHILLGYSTACMWSNSPKNCLYCAWNWYFIMGWNRKDVFNNRSKRNIWSAESGQKRQVFTGTKWSVWWNNRNSLGGGTKSQENQIYVNSGQSGSESYTVRVRSSQPRFDMGDSVVLVENEPNTYTSFISAQRLSSGGYRGVSTWNSRVRILPPQINYST